MHLGTVMSNENGASIGETYARDGYFFPLRAMSAQDAAEFRAKLEAHEKINGGSLQAGMRHQTHLLFTWADELVRHPKILDAVDSYHLATDRI